MTTHGFDEVLVVLNVPPSIEEVVVDWLLGQDARIGFTSFPVSGHSTRHDNLSAAEQVSGRQSRQQFQVQITADEVSRFIDDAEGSFGAAGIHFWILPVLAGGTLGSV